MYQFDESKFLVSTHLLGSTCVDGIAEYKCVCVNGMTGKNCEIDIGDFIKIVENKVEIYLRSQLI